VAGDRDDLCPWPDLEALGRNLQPPVDLRVVSGADHFYGGREQELYRILKDYPLPEDPA
jgi:alpha/beta superfamily hydrolase